jgi:hypothetical protein
MGAECPATWWASSIRRYNTPGPFEGHLAEANGVEPSDALPPDADLGLLGSRGPLGSRVIHRAGRPLMFERYNFRVLHFSFFHFASFTRWVISVGSRLVGWHVKNVLAEPDLSWIVAEETHPERRKQETDGPSDIGNK